MIGDDSSGNAGGGGKPGGEERTPEVSEITSPSAGPDTRKEFLAKEHNESAKAGYYSQTAEAVVADQRTDGAQTRREHELQRDHDR